MHSLKRRHLTLGSAIAAIVMGAAAIVLMVVVFSTQAPEADATNTFEPCPTSSVPTDTAPTNTPGGPTKTARPSATPCKVVSTPTQTPTITPTKQPAPADTDGDGCSDEAENGPDVALGGQRDYLYFWDFYDVWTHPADDPLGWERNGLINIFDIIQVAAQFGIPLGYLGDVGDKAALVERALTPPSDLPPQGGGGVASHGGVEPDNPAYDRGPFSGPSPWHLGPPDGTINITDDILRVAAQFGHDCT